MATLLALEWDDAEARIAVAETRRGSVVLEQAFSVDLPQGFSPEAGAPPGAGPISMSGAHDLGAIGRHIRDALSARGIRRAKTLVAVGRANIELKNLTVPPAPPEEMPDMVRLQAEREFNTLGDAWPLDFIPIPGEGEETITVLAAAISPELVSEIEVTCEAANLTPERLVLRPCAAASLLSRTKPGAAGKLRLLVDIVAEEADLTVLSGDSVVFMRTTRLPTELFRTDPLRAILPEIRRTIAAVHARIHGKQVAEIYLCGEGNAQGQLATDIGRELDLQAEVFNPLTACTLGGELLRSMPDHPSRFAPLVGMLLDDSAGDANTIDFLNPRKRPEAKNYRKQLAIAGGVVGFIAFVIAAWVWIQLGNLDSEIAQRRQIETQTTQDANKLKDVTEKAAKINRWLGGGTSELSWLDEIAAMAQKVPPAQDLMYTTMSLPYQETPAGTKNAPAAPRLDIHLEALARDPDVLKEFYKSLDDERHDVKNPKTEPEKGGKYPWKVDLHVEVRPPSTVASAADSKTGAKNANAKGAGKAVDADKKSTDAKATDTKKADEKKSDEKKPDDKQSDDKKSAEPKADDKKPGEKAPADKAADKPAAEKGPEAVKTKSEKPAESKPTDGSSAEKNSAEKPAAAVPTATPPATSQPATQQPAAAAQPAATEGNI